MIDNDPEGRYLKIAIMDPTSRQCRTLATCYLEPAFSSYDQIPDHILTSDFFCGDMNQFMSGLQRKGVHHYSTSLSFLKEIQAPINMSDHNVMLFNFLAPYNNWSNTTEVKITDKSSVNSKYTSISNKLSPAGQQDPCTSVTLRDPRKIIIIENDGDTIHPDNFERYTELKERAKLEFTEFLKSEKRRMSVVVTNGQIDRQAWNKIDKLISGKTKNRLYFPDGNEEKIIEGFSRLYQDDPVKPDCEVNITDKILTIMERLSEDQCLKTQAPIFRPRSTAKDEMGFSQHTNFDYIEGTNLSQNWVNFISLCKVARDSNLPGLFFHNYVRIMLVRKIDNPVTSDDLRGLGILPARVMNFKKLTLPILEEIIGPTLCRSQHGAIKGSNTTLAKFVLFFNAKNKGYRKSNLFDVRKA